MTPESRTTDPGVVGRFAPSPTGPPHFGTLLAALGSFLLAKSQNGKWLLRVEDLDPPRVVTGTAEQFLQLLDALGFERRKEACDALDGEVRHVQTVHRAVQFLRHEAQKQQQRIAVAADRVGTQAPLDGEKILEERDQIAAQGRRGRATHEAPPSIRSAHEPAKRWLARATTAGMKRR